MNRITVLHKGQALYFDLEKEFNRLKRTISFSFIPADETSKTSVPGKLQMVYDNVEHVFVTPCEQLQINYDLCYSLQKYLRESEAA